MSIPPLFRCPISLDLFTDPVTLCTGQTYDRPNIEKWLADGNKTCPVTMQRLQDLTMVPNRTLRQLIDQWLLMGTQFDLEHIAKTNLDLSLATLKRNLQSQETTFAERIQTLRTLRALSEESESACLIQLGFFPILLQLLFQNYQLGNNLNLEDLELAEEALNCLMNLSPYSDLGSLNMLKEASGLASFSILLNHGNMKIKTSLCFLVEAISSSTETKDLCLMLAQTRAILHALISLLQQNSNQDASDAATGAISGLCFWESNRDNIVREGGVDGLITYLLNPQRRRASRALATLELLLGLESGKRAVIGNPNAVNVLVKLVFIVSDHECSESAVSSLLIICYDSLQMREESINAGVLTQLLLLLQSQCSGKAKTKARVLLKLLRSMWAEDPGMCYL